LSKPASKPIWEDKFLDPELHEKCKVLFKDASILVTGGTGSFGQTFIRTLLEFYEPRRVIVLSRDELKQSEMQKEFSVQKYPAMRYFLGDVRDPARLQRAFRGVDIIVHAAALKQVPALEYNPTEAIKTNIMGAMNIIEAAIDCNVNKIVALSTDKAAMPVNLYGATKLCSDKLFVAGNMSAGSGRTRFAVVRYGNVFGSRGSIVPVIHALRQKEEKMIGLTDVRMTRFNITLTQAVNFVLSALVTMHGGEVFIPKLPSYKLPQVAAAVAPECATRVIGRRPGEKVHELMVPEDEAYRTKEIADRYIIEPEWESFGAIILSLSQK
jgi:UDP-N-acetylglucosamine 4,6-dehydratase